MKRLARWRNPSKCLFVLGLTTEIGNQKRFWLLLQLKNHDLTYFEGNWKNYFQTPAFMFSIDFLHNPFILFYRFTITKYTSNC